MYRKWKEADIQTAERPRYAFAGYGNIEKARRRAVRRHDAVIRWSQVADFAPGETRRYVERIEGLMRTAR